MIILKTELEPIRTELRNRNGVKGKSLRIRVATASKHGKLQYGVTLKMYITFCFPFFQPLALYYNNDLVLGI